MSKHLHAFGGWLRDIVLILSGMLVFAVAAFVLVIEATK